MTYYRDLRDYLATLEARGKLVRVSRPINKDTEIHPLARLQYRGLPEAQRKAFLFENVLDSRANRYRGGYAVCAIAGSGEIYALGMQCSQDEIGDRWLKAMAHQIAPVIVPAGPCQEEIHVGDGLLAHGGLDEFPFPISTPGFDNAAYLSAPFWVTKDPETGVRNVGTYRAQIKARDRTGTCPSTPSQGITQHWQKARRLGRPLEAAVALGCTPNIAYVSASPIPHGTDEFAVAGALAGGPVELVRCQTVNLEVPACSEIVIEGIIPVDAMETEAPFGEGLGYMGIRNEMPYFQVTGITHRRDPILLGFMAECPPSEGSKLLEINGANLIRRFLKQECDIPSVVDIALHESSSSILYIVVRMRSHDRAAATRVMDALVSPKGRAVAQFGKVFVLVDEDIDPWNADAVNWAIGTRSQPHRDIRIVEVPAVNVCDPSVESTDQAVALGVWRSSMPQKSLLLIDATMKWPYPPVSLPTKQHMERARALWSELGLPEFDLVTPWHGYQLGYWTEEDAGEAALAEAGRYYETGEKNAAQRKML